MERVTGIGGFFFRARDPEKLGEWYAEHLGVDEPPTSYDGDPPWQQEQGPTVFAPFPVNSEHFTTPDQNWSINFRVRDLDAMLGQLRAAGIEVEPDPQTYPNGRFANLVDPEGNQIQLWQPA
jgi:catechol 2,3-dioxygenase-like lactoylglutathione lyase family enzyme